MYSIKEYSELTGIHKRKVQRLAKSGKIKAEKVGNYYVILERIKKEDKMKILTLKLIETKEPEKEGDLITDLNGALYVRGKYDIKTPTKVVLPYGISDEEIKLDDTFYRDSGVVSIMTQGLLSYYDSIKDKSVYKQYKVELLPKDFSYYQLVVLGLKDGDKFNLELESFKSESEYFKAIIKPLH